MKIKHILFNFLPKFLKNEILDYLRRNHSLKTYDITQLENPVFESSIASFDYYKCIFVHIPKNAGLSVSYTLFGNTGGSHRKIINYKKIFSKRTFNSYYKFSFVRNPWDRLVSTYFFLKADGITKKDKLWSENNLGKYNDFNVFVSEWLTEENISNSLHFQHQHSFLENEKGEIKIDFIGRVENIEEDFETIVARLNINRSLKNTNKSKRKKDYKQYYNEESKAVVAKVYHKDIELFNYEF